MHVGFAMRPAGRSMDFSGACPVSDQLAFCAAAVPDVKSVVKAADGVIDVDDDADYPDGDNDVPDDGRDATNGDEASIIDDYFGLHDVTTTSGADDVIVPEIPRAYDADDSRWLEQSTATPTSGSAVTSQHLQFTSDQEMRDRKYYGFVSPADFVDLGGYGTSGFEPRPPPCYPTKREGNSIDDEVLLRSSETGNIARVNKFYTGSYSAADAYFAQYGTGAFPVLIDHGQYGGGIATAGVLSDARQQNYIPANATTTGNGSSCAGYLSVDVGGFGSTMLRPLGFQSSTAAWPAAFRQ